MFKRFYLLLIFVSLQLSAQVLIFTHSYNRPDFIEIQARTFSVLLEDEYELVVFNDGPNEEMKKKIEKTCKKLGLRCIRVPQELHVGDGSPGSRHVHGIEYAFRLIGYDHKGIVALVDSDLFLIKPFSIEKYLAGYDVAGELQGRGNATIEVRYLSPILIFMNMQTLPNKRTFSLAGGTIHGFGCDTGAQSYYYFQNNPTAHRKLIYSLHPGNLAYNIGCQICSNLTCQKCLGIMWEHNIPKNVISFIHECPNLNVEFFLDCHFLHYRGGSNWDGQAAEYHRIKTQALNHLIDKIIAENK